MKKKTGITLKGGVARAFMAQALISAKGEKAAENTSGPMKEEIEKQLAARGVVTESHKEGEVTVVDKFTLHSVSIVKHPEPGCEIKKE